MKVQMKIKIKSNQLNLNFKQNKIVDSSLNISN